MAAIGSPPVAFGSPPVPRLGTPSSAAPMGDSYSSVAPGGRGSVDPSLGIAQLEGVVREFRRLQDSRQPSPAAREEPQEAQRTDGGAVVVVDGTAGDGGAGSEDLDSLMQQVHKLQDLLKEGPYRQPEEGKDTLDKPPSAQQPLLTPPPSPFSKGGTRSQLAEVLSRLGSGNAPSPSSSRLALASSGHIGSVRGSGPPEEDVVWEEFQVHVH